MSDIITKISQILDNDPQTQKIMTEFRDAAIRTGVTPEQYQEAKKIMFMACLKANEQAFQIYSEWMYHELRGEN